MRCAPRPRPRRPKRRSTWYCWTSGSPTPAGSRWRRRLSGLRPAPDIIAITSERDLEMVRAAVGHGALAYLLKPFTFAAFRDRLERYRRYREALPAGTDAASQAEVDRALAELRVAADRSAAPKGAAPGHQRRDRPRGKGFRRRHHGRRSGQTGRGVAGDGVALPRTARRRGHAHATHRLRQGGAAQDPLHLALDRRRLQLAKPAQRDLVGRVTNCEYSCGMVEATENTLTSPA